MAHTDRTKQTDTDRTRRRRLRREVPSTVGLLADERDFTAMRRYDTFDFDDHATYLRQIDALLRSLTAQGVHTTVALFDPDEYAEFCAAGGHDPDTTASRSRYTATIPATGAAVAYTGQPLDTLVPQLINTAVRRATWEYVTALLADLGACADCGQDIGRAAFDRASHLLFTLLETAGPGIHHIVCSIPADDEQLLASLQADRTGPTDPTDPDTFAVDPTEGAEFVSVLAAGIALERPGGVVLRTTAPGTPDRLHGWRLLHGHLVPLTEAEVFSAYCTDADTGEPLSPESGVEYRAGFDLGLDTTDHHH
ncbi:hypothetical protein [Streptomyces liangshanensis]|uniref:hypothetical protein n=1 Tax=Streptomyces liangshanensis TaxID=2717324 RepID=UPI0036D933F9